MLKTTVSRLQCPRCGGPLGLSAGSGRGAETDLEVRSGELRCKSCKVGFPILSGVAILIEDPTSYILQHVKGISQIVPDEEIPSGLLRDYRMARDEIETEHIEEDLEAERVISLYLMNHYLRVEQASGAKSGAPRAPARHGEPGHSVGPARSAESTRQSETHWWKPAAAPVSPVIDRLIREHWDHGPFAQIAEWVGSLKSSSSSGLNVVELGCGVGGLQGELQRALSRRVGSALQSYLGVDSSFASIALARHLALGMPYPRKIKIPQDLLQGPVSREVKIPLPEKAHPDVDFVVGDFEGLPVKRGIWDLSVALNAIDMLPEPPLLPRLQAELAGKEGFAIQSCPYIWHEGVARELRRLLPKKPPMSSSQAVEWLYSKAGFQIQKSVENIPWLFFKHVRQLEIYSVHLFLARMKA